MLNNVKKFLDYFLAEKLGQDSSIGVAEVKPSTARTVEGTEYHITPSKDRATLIKRLGDPVQSSDYAGAYLEYMHNWVVDRAPAGTSDKQTLDLAVIGYNLGPENLTDSFQAHGFGGLGNEGRTYASHVLPQIPTVAAYLYGN